MEHPAARPDGEVLGLAGARNVVNPEPVISDVPRACATLRSTAPTSKPSSQVREMVRGTSTATPFATLVAVGPT
jgi:hypothetical protein